MDVTIFVRQEAPASMAISSTRTTHTHKKMNINIKRIVHVVRELETTAEIKTEHQLDTRIQGSGPSGVLVSRIDSQKIGGNILVARRLNHLYVYMKT